MSRKIEKGISRRTFIKSTAVGAGIIASTGSGLIENSPDQAHAATQTKKYSFEIPPPAIPASDIKKTVTADVVVVGTPIDLCPVLNLNKVMVRVTYELQEVSSPNLMEILSERLPRK